MTSENKPITAESTLAEILEQNPANQEILAKHHLPCLTCPMMGFEVTFLKLGDVCRMYGLDAEAILKDLTSKTQ